MSDISEVTGPMIGIGGIICGLGGVAGLVEVFLWLRYGIWLHHDLLWAAGVEPATSWGGIDQLISWLWVQPLWSVIAGAGSGLALLGIVIEKS